MSNYGKYLQPPPREAVAELTEKENAVKTTIAKNLGEPVVKMQTLQAEHGSETKWSIWQGAHWYCGLKMSRNFGSSRQIKKCNPAKG